MIQTTVYAWGYDTPGVFEGGDYSPGDWNHDRDERAACSDDAHEGGVEHTDD